MKHAVADMIIQAVIVIIYLAVHLAFFPLWGLWSIYKYAKEKVGLRSHIYKQIGTIWLMTLLETQHNPFG